jgi:hypothetical protein
MVIEGIITTENRDGSMHIAPIGPHVNDSLTEWTLKPYQSSTTFSNLHATQRGVFHVTDDALLMVAAVMGLCNDAIALDKVPNETVPKEMFAGMIDAVYVPDWGWVLQNSCRVFALQIDRWDVAQPRAVADCQLIGQKEQRPFWGWNRACHSLLELAVLASRSHMLDLAAHHAELSMHKTIIEKTAGLREKAAWQLISTTLPSDS